MVVARKHWRRGALVGLLVATAGACSGGDDAAPTTTATIAAPPASSAAPVTSVAPVTVTPTTALPADPGELGVLDAALAADGTMDLDAALALVAAGYRPLPGVTAALTPLVDGGPALRTVVANVAALAPEQQTAVAAIVAPPGTPLADAAASPSPVLADAAATVARSLAAFGRTAEDLPITLLELPADNGDSTRNFSSSAALATAVVARDGQDVECRIRVDVAAQPGDPAFDAAVARETFHCGQYARAAAIEAVPLWVVEGAAAYAADAVAGPTALTAPAWQRWVGQPQRPLTARVTDAIGFFALVDEAADPFAFADALLGDPSADSVRRRLELTDVFDRWGRAYATQPDWEGGFAFAAPGAAGLTAPRSTAALTVDGPPVALGGGADLSATAYAVTAPGDVLVVTASPGDRGAIRFANGQHAALAQATQAVCLLPGGCACPGVAADALSIGEAGGAEVFVGVGPSSGTGPTLAARSLPRWCQEVAAPPPADVVDPCLVGTWRTRSYVAPESPGVAQTVTGGEGGTLTFGADRSATVDLSTMSPVVIDATGISGVRSTTTLTYRGTGAGTWRADGGVVEVAGVDPASFGIRVQVTAADGSLLGDVDLPLTDVRLAYYVTPLGTARYACTPVSLSLTHVLPGLGVTAGFELSPT